MKDIQFVTVPKNKKESFLNSQKLWLDGVVLILLLIIHLVIGTLAVNRQSATYDEGVHIASGYNYLVTGSYTVDRINQPPLLRILSAIPLLVLRPESFTERPESKGEAFAFADLFLYHNKYAADSILAAGRYALFWGLSPLLGILIYFWSRNFGGRIAGSAAAGLYALCPVILANAPLVMTDFGLSVFCFTALYTLYKAVLSEEQQLRLNILFGLSMGASLASKISAIILLGIVPLSIVVYWILSGNSGVLWRSARIFVVALPIAAAVVLFTYRFDQIWMLWETIRWKFTETQRGVLHISYIFGYASTEGWWYYFPICFLLKTPLIVLLLLALAIFKCMEQIVDGTKGVLGEWRARICSGPWATGGAAAVISFILIPPAVWMAVACTSKLQIGLRHILPIYPFCRVAAGITAGKIYESGSLLRRICLWLMAVSYVWSAISVYPNYLADFNSIVLDKTQAFRYLADANLDTGQGLKELGQNLKHIGSPPIYLSYFGNADPHAYGIQYVPIAWFTDVPRKGDDIDPFKMKSLLFVISASNRAGMYYNNRNLMKWLENYTPIAIIANSIFVYDFTHNPQALIKISAILQLQGDGINAKRLIERAQKTEDKIEMPSTIKSSFTPFLRNSVNACISST